MEFDEWLKEQIDLLKHIQDDFRYGMLIKHGMLKAFEMCLEKYKESEDDVDGDND